jgi:O-methyltransferase domain/Dimerisation domain
MDSKRTSTTLLTTLLRVPGGSALIAGYTGLVRGLGLLRRALVPTEVALLEMIMGSYRSQALAAACRLGVLEHMAGGPRLAAELARKMGADPEHLGRLLEFLTASGIVRRGRGEAYGLTRFGRGLLDGRAGSLKAFAEFNGAAPTWQAWAALDASVISGRSAFHIAHGEEFFPFAQRHSAFAAVFDRAMVGFSEALGPLLAAAYRFGPGTVVDVGGGRGALLAGVLQHQPDLAGVLYDLPEVIAAAPAYLAAAGVAGRVEVVGGSFFDSVPTGHDYYVLKNVLHDWSDGECGVILGHIANAIKPSGRLLVVEMLRGPRAFPLPAAMDLGMMVLTRGGRERSRAEFARLLQSAGFELRSVVSASAFMSILVAEPVSVQLLQSGPSVIPEQIGVPDIGLEHVPLVPGHVAHLDHRNTMAGRTGQESGA